MRDGRTARIAVIGTGWWATYTHIPALLEHPEATLVALCDADPTRLAAAAQASGGPRTYSSHSALLAAEGLDGVIVATSHASHYPIVRDCLERGLHVMVEKPMTLRAREARELIELAAARGRELIVGYPYHYSPHVLAAREAVVSGSLGAVQYVCCTFSSHIIELLRGRDGSERAGAYPVHGPGAVYSRPEDSGGGMGHLQLTHSTGALFFVSGLRAERVLALMHNHGLALDLVDSATVAFAGGALGVVGGTGNGIHRRFDLQIHCEDGAVELDLVRNSGLIRGPGEARRELAPLAEAQAYPRFAPAHNLVEVALGRAANGSPPEAGLRSVELLDAAYRSAARDGEAVTVASLYS